MHEMSLAEGVIQVLEDSARAQEFQRVKKVWLEIGQLAQVEVEAMRFCFEAVCKHSIAEGAELVVIATPGRGRCQDCGQQFDYPALYEPCPRCQGYQIQLVSGDEMRVKKIEVE